MSSSDQIATVVVNVRGGVVQDVVATESVRVIVVDYDIDEELADDFPTIVARNGSKDKAFVSVDQVTHDPEYVQGVEDAIKP
ncbi:MAG TPA: hypothetical protein VJ727_08470 [Rhodanobacteraceae bacterium]|nr:hypothetical protein [Rhodanobacteraceae bacterium]